MCIRDSDIAGHHIGARLLGAAGGLQHGVGFAHAGSVAEEYFQLAGRLFFLLPDAAQQLFRIRTRLLHAIHLPVLIPLVYHRRRQRGIVIFLLALKSHKESPVYLSLIHI